MVATKERRKSGGITLSAGELRTALAAVSPAVPSRAARPVLTNVRLGDGLVTGTDLEVRIDVAIDYHGDAMLLPHSRLLAILNAAGGDEVTLEPKGTQCVVRCGHGTWTLPVEDAAEFPLWEPANAKPVTRLPADQFARAVRGVVFAADQESSRYALGAVLVEVQDGVVNFVATDGRRLCSCEMEHDLAVDDRRYPKHKDEKVSPPLLVPSRVMQILARVAGTGDEESVQLEATGNELLASIGGTTVTARLTEGRFPRWRDVIPSEGAEPTTVLATAFLSATKAAAIVTSENSKGVQYTFTAEGIHLHGQSAEAGESSVTCEIVEAGHACTVKLDPIFVREWLSGLPADGEPTVSVQAKDGESAVVLRTDTFTGVIMPLAKD
jgi:DNA polymerase-3 subunit beta